MKVYTAPILSVIMLETADIITSSFLSLSWDDFKNTSDVDNDSGL